MKPLLLHYYITTRCNARCSFCTIWRESPTADASLPDVVSNLSCAKKAGCRFVDFTGGEPLLNRNLPAFLLSAKKNGFFTSVTTNCLIFPDRAGELAGLIDLLHFSIDADTPELHDAIRGRRSFERVLESIDIALQNRLFPDLLFTYTNENIDSFEGIYRLARQKKLIVILDPLFNLDDRDSVAGATHAKAVAYAKRPGVYLNRAHLTLRAAGGNKSAAPLCKAVDSTIVILPDNKLVLPCFHHRIDFLPINNDLDKLIKGAARKKSAEMQGTYQFCEQCHINCYFDPSYGYMHNRMFLQSMGAKLKYAWWKHGVYGRPILKQSLPREP
jgi:MoaA/NifB/PqqE/SkfB family radical SAM enzyme